MPFLTLTVLGTARRRNNELQCEPTVLDVREILSSCFGMIIGVASGIPSIENILFPEIQEMEFLFAVYRREKVRNKT